MKKTTILLVLLALSALLLAGCQKEAAPAAETENTITVEVIHGDESAKTVTITTTETTLGGALLGCEELGVSGEQGSYGLFIETVDGESASDDAHTYWSILQNGEETATGADETPIADGDSFTLALVSWDQ